MKYGKEEFVPYAYQIGSITKTFTGAMIAYEEARGKIDMMQCAMRMMAQRTQIYWDIC